MNDLTSCAGLLATIHRWLFPLPLKKLHPTNDSMSFQNIDITKEVEIPCPDHVGAFGVERRHDVHKGVDLYCPVGTPVFAVEDGLVVNIRPFTGVNADCPWWEDTWAVSVAGKSGVVVYGEIYPFWARGRYIDVAKTFAAISIKKGDLIGHVKRVLKKNKGRPTSMLHLALHSHGILLNGVWVKGQPQPEGLLDPTPFLIGAEQPAKL